MVVPSKSGRNRSIVVGCADAFFDPLAFNDNFPDPGGGACWSAIAERDAATSAGYAALVKILATGEFDALGCCVDFQAFAPQSRPNIRGLNGLRNR